MTSEPTEPTTTSVTARARRPLSYSTFADITDARLVQIVREAKSTTLIFDGELCEAQVLAVWARMESADDDDQASRGALRDAMAGGALNLAAMTAAYVLGDDMPALILPEPAETEEAPWPSPTTP